MYACTPSKGDSVTSQHKHKMIINRTKAKWTVKQIVHIKMKMKLKLTLKLFHFLFCYLKARRKIENWAYIHEKKKYCMWYVTRKFAYLQTIVGKMSTRYTTPFNVLLFRIDGENGGCQQKNHTYDPHLGHDTVSSTIRWLHFLHIFSNTCTLFPYQNKIFFTAFILWVVCLSLFLSLFLLFVCLFVRRFYVYNVFRQLITLIQRFSSKLNFACSGRNSIQCLCVILFFSSTSSLLLEI